MLLQWFRTPLCLQGLDNQPPPASSTLTHAFLPDPPDLQPHWPRLSAPCPALLCTRCVQVLCACPSLTCCRPPPDLSDPHLLAARLRDSSSIYLSFTSLTRGPPGTALTSGTASLFGKTDSQSHTMQSRFSSYTCMTHLPNCTTAPWQQDNTCY